MKREKGMAPVLPLPQRRKFSIVRMRKEMPRKKQATFQETEIHPEMSPTLSVFQSLIAT